MWIPNLGPLPESKLVQKSLAQYKPKLVSYDSQVKVGAPGAPKIDSCPECGHDVNKAKDKVCPNCGHEITNVAIKPVEMMNGSS